MKPSWGKTIGVFFLCWVLAFLSCVFASLIVGHFAGLPDYSTGGLSMPVVGIICAAIYRSRGKVAGVAIGSIVVGAMVGLLAVLISVQMVTGQTALTERQSNYSDKTATSGSLESGSSEPSSEDYVKTSIEDPTSLVDSPLAKSVVAKGRDEKKWSESKYYQVDEAFKRITFGQFSAGNTNASRPNNRQIWNNAGGIVDASFTDLHELLYVALSEMLDDPEQAKGILSNPNVSAYTKTVMGDTIDYVDMYDTFEVDGKQYMYSIHFVVDSETHSQIRPGNKEIEIGNYDIHSQYGETVGRMQDLGWSVFDS